MASKIVSFTLNGRETEIIAKPLVTLQTVLRQQLNRTATKAGCNQGGCGSCTVLVDGEPMLSCLLPVADVDGRVITTLEGLGSKDNLHPLQQSFLEEYALQCGYCSPGMIITAKALLDHNPNPSRSEIADAISGNVCRCTGYLPILAAIENAAQRINGGEA
ncbi:MAG: (2Fe-2S)-binding protein [Anaerolineae bacterium]|nr:(2Fe-2S)-binding protein [Anaerolineae bacterium]